jgi:L-alanine-DL-glutamate epimerase-like enolase superfamily enzyme
MITLTRRSFLAKSTAASLAAIASPAYANIAPENRTHPLDGIERENIRITDITVTPLSYVDPTGNLWRHGNRMIWKCDAAPCRVYTNQGIIGIGEGTPYASPDKIKVYTETVLKPMLVGKNPWDAIRMRQVDASNFVHTASWAGVEVALWDIIGRIKGKPVYELLSVDGKPETRLHMYASGGVQHEWYNNGADFLATEAVRYQALGFDAFKLRRGTEWQFSNMTFKKYEPILRRLRDAVGPDFKLMHEIIGGTGMPIEQVVNEFCPLLDELDFHWFEMPIPGMENYIRIAKKLKRVLVSGGETERSLASIKPWIESGALEIVQSDCNVTGLTENWLISRLADAHGRMHCPHNWHGGLTTIGNAHLVAAIPNRHMLETNMTFNPLKEAIFKDPLVVKNGWMDLPNKPGFGVELIDNVEKKFPYVPGDFRKQNPRIPG